MFTHARPARILPLIAAAGWVGSALAAEPPPAGPAPPPLPRRSLALRETRAGNWARARGMLDALVKAHVDDADLLYALAVCQAQQGESGACLKTLAAALGNGFQDYHALHTEPRLAPVRAAPEFAAILKAADERQERFDADLEAGVRETYQRTEFRVSRHASPRIILVTNLDEGLAGRLVAALEGFERSHRAVLFPNGIRHAIVVYAAKPASPAGAAAPVLFTPASRTLQVNVQLPMGGVMREFTQAIHFDDQAALGQAHAPWLTAGIQALYESASTPPTGIRAVADWRLASLKLGIGKPGFLRLADLLAAKKVSASPQALTEARYLLFWLQETGQLRGFYRNYVEGYDEDASGRGALETTLGKPIAAIETAWLGYLKRLGG